MFDKSLVLAILEQIDEALEKIKKRMENIGAASDFTSTPAGMEKLDGICMQFAATGDALKKLDKITSGKLFAPYEAIDWKGVIGFRDIIVHHYFDIDAEQVFWICANNLEPLSAAIKQMIKKLQ